MTRGRRRPSETADGGRRRSAILAFATGLALATATLVWLSWAATMEMRRSTRLVFERRASEVLALTSAALNRDMRGAWLAALVPMDLGAISEDPPYDLLQLTSRTFARFPYPESFIVWMNDGSADGRTYAFNRADRPLPWVTGENDEEPYPVMLLRDPPALKPLVAGLREEAEHGRQFAFTETMFQGVPYQTVAHFLFAPPKQGRLAGLVAFTVNLDWVRKEYLGELLRQVASIDGEPDAMAVSVLDERGHTVATSGGAGGTAPVRQRTFPLLFLEPSLVPPGIRSGDTVRLWTAQVQPAAGAIDAASALSLRMVAIASLGGAAALVALLLTVRAVRASAELAAMKSEFVSAVTHELKTPLALIKLVGETLERGRYTSPETIREYAALLSQQERRLGHLIENLLTYSRLSDLNPLYSREAVDLAEIAEDALEPFRPRLKDLGFALDVTVDPELPQVRGDRVSLVQVFANLIDNAIKYSPERRTLTIEAASRGDWVRVRFADGGIGIPAAELPNVFDKFYRGREAREFGSGLGLAIVKRIAQHHGGSVEIESVPGTGTTVTVVLPVMRMT
ncbi:MAG: HAMP domain-containing histidine kinase [Acidobacteria bacterium]|nr:HAMP domain-containing histidine kinase [Acidobacteriota bacterium]